MIEVEGLQEQVKRLKAKIKEVSAKKESNPKEARAIRKHLKRAQRKIRYFTGKKLASKKAKGGEAKEAKPAAPAGEPAPAEVKAAPKTETPAAPKA